MFLCSACGSWSPWRASKHQTRLYLDAPARQEEEQHKTTKMKMLFPCVVLHQESSFLADPSSCRISLRRARERETDRQTERDTQKHRDTHTDTQTERKHLEIDVDGSVQAVVRFTSVVWKRFRECKKARSSQMRVRSDLDQVLVHQLSNFSQCALHRSANLRA